MRKFLLALFSVLLFVCLGAAVACAGSRDDSVNYYTLVFRQTNGVSYQCDVKSGWEVKEGTTVNFKLVINEEAQGVPVVYANGTELPANEDKSYSVTVTANTTITVGGLMAQGKEYNRLVFDNTPGVTFTGEERELADGTTIKLESGMMVKMNEVISFGFTVNPKYQGTPVVYANDTVLEADVNNRYSLDMIAPTTIRVEGLVKHVDLTYQSGDTRVRYYTGDDNNKSYLYTDTIEDRTEGEEIKFKVQISVYYKQNTFEVLANSTILTPGADGYYSFEISDDTVITVSNLVMETSFLERANGGSGTIRNPFRISKAIDLYQMAMQINGGFFTEGRFYAAYYSLDADIDMQGEQLYIIGDGSTGVSVFSGTFYGNGHTISNYTMTDLWIDQENFNSVFITNVGLFGNVVPTTNSSPAIYNLNLDNFTITADASAYPAATEDSDYTLSVGAIAGVAYGLDMIGCSATNGTIEVMSGDYGGYVGGLLGQQVSAYSATVDIQAYSGVSSCHADVDIYVADSSDTSFIYAAGGITGCLVVGEEHLSSYILNSYATGTLEGALNVGGVVGYASAGTSIINCYSAGDITAYSHFEYNSNWTGDYAYFQEFYNASAGGIVGRAGFNSVIYNSFSMGEVYSSSALDLEYNTKEHSLMSHVAAYIESGDELQDAHAYETSIYGCAQERITSITPAFLRDTMHWDEEDWILENGRPVINFDSAEKQFTIKFSAVDKAHAGDFGKIEDINVHISEDGPINGYLTMSMWNSLTNGGIPEFVESTGNNSLRSYAYFFDAELTQRVFYSFIPTGNMTLYVGYADYSEVEGTYYLGESTDSAGARIEVAADGTFVYYNGALNHHSTYTYDGENIVFLYAYLGDLAELDPQYRDYYLSSLYVFGATLENGKLTITGGYVQEVEYHETITGYLDESTPIFGQILVNTGNSFDLFTAESPLIGVRKIEGFEYGSYFDNGSIYTFNGNGTGLFTEGEKVTVFTYKVSGNALSITYNGQTEPVAGTIVNGYVKTIGNATVNPYDGFTGRWERPFSINEYFTFDGKASNGNTGSWTYSGFDTSVPSSGTYTVSGNKLTANGGYFTAEINEEGFLEIKLGSISNIYYMGGSFAGNWYYSHRLGGYSNTTITIDLTLNGISNNGYGTAKAEYGTGEVYNLTYHAVSEKDTYKIYIYQNEYLFASVSYDDNDIALMGTVDGMAGGRFTAYDSFKGLWVSNNANLPTVQFNGNGFNDLAAQTDGNGAGSLAVRSTVFVDGKSAGSYSIDRSTMVGKYVLKSKNGEFTYTLKYNELLDIIEVNGSDGSKFNLMHRDMWYGRQLEDENGYVYTFQDGRGNLVDGGTLVASNGNAVEQRIYTYYLNTDGSIKLEARGSYAGGTISVKEYNGKTVFLFEQTSGAKVSLVRHTAFTGEWLIGGESGVITIDKIYANEKASGSYQFHGESKVSVEFNYDFAGNYLTFDYDGTTMYVNALVSANATELSIGTDNNISSANNSICISIDKADEYFGKTFYIYDTKSGKDTGETLVFDGLSASVFGNGTAVMYNNDGGVIGAYVYKIKAGSVSLMYNRIEYFMTEQTIKPDRELSAFELFCVRDGDSYFMMVRPDSLADLTVKDAINPNITYTFNGVGGVVCHNPASGDVMYSYIIVLSDNVLFKHILQFTDAAGTVYSVTFDKSGNSADEWTIKMTVADKYFGLVAWDGDSDEAYFLFDGAGRVIRLSNVDSVVNYKYEVIPDQTNDKKATFIFTNESGVQYTATFDMSSSNSAEWKVTLEKR